MKVLKRNLPDRQPVQRDPYNGQPPLPARQSRKKKKSMGKAVLAAIIICSFLLVVAVAGGAYINQLLNLVDRSEVTGDADAHESDLVDPDDLSDETDSSDAITKAAKEYEIIKEIPVRQDQDIYNILLIGTDQENYQSRGRSDAMIILSINKKTKKIHLTSLMRAMYVAIPGKDWSMLNHAYAWGGPDLLIETIENNFRIRIDEYVAINFSGFRKAIDLVGGVSITLSDAEANRVNSSVISHLRGGDNLHNGALTFAYDRIRKLDSDFVRTSRQRTVIEALLKKSRSLNVIQINNLTQNILPLVNTSLSQGEMLSLMASMVHVRNYPIDQLMLPEEANRERIYVRKMEMYRIDFRKTIDRLHQFIDS